MAARGRRGADKTQAESGRELVITRVFDAPRELVFRAWVDPEHLVRWSAPKGFTIWFNEGEVRPGGSYRLCMRSPEGEDHWLRGVYREIVEPERLVFTHVWESDPDHETVVTVTFAERGGKTEMTFRQGPFKSAESRDGHAEGWTECFEKLDDLLASIHAA
jgi:uncharacterized protein YndB with AHSA1/START domain